MVEVAELRASQCMQLRADLNNLSTLPLCLFAALTRAVLAGSRAARAVCARLVSSQRCLLPVLWSTSFLFLFLLFLPFVEAPPSQKGNLPTRAAGRVGGGAVATAAGAAALAASFMMRKPRHALTNDTQQGSGAGGTISPAPAASSRAGGKGKRVGALTRQLRFTLCT